MTFYPPPFYFSLFFSVSLSHSLSFFLSLFLSISLSLLYIILFIFFVASCGFRCFRFCTLWSDLLLIILDIIDT